MKLEDYKAWLLQHGEIKEEYERPYNPQCDLIDSGFDYDDEAVDDRYQEELESWLSYYVEPEEE